jgi:hypothetical protein
MLFHIKQVHTPEMCPYGKGGSGSLHDKNAPGIKLVGFYGAFMEHTIYMIVEADDIDALHRFLLPGMLKCTTEITPVSDHPIPI